MEHVQFKICTKIEVDEIHWHEIDDKIGNFGIKENIHSMAFLMAFFYFTQNSDHSNAV